MLEAMEHGDQYQYMPLRKTKSGLGDYAVSRQQLRLLEDYVNNQMIRMTDQILGGGFAPHPSTGESVTIPAAIAILAPCVRRIRSSARAAITRRSAPRHFGSC